MKLIGAYQSNRDQLRQEILTSSTIQVPLPKFSWKLELEPPREIVEPSSIISNSQTNHTPNGLSPDLIELSAKESHHLKVEVTHSDIPSSDSEKEQTDTEREMSRNKKLSVNQLSHHHQGKMSKTKRNGSPTWSTASESPTPTNSTHTSVDPERPWATNSQSWQGLLCEEQRQLLGTEEESSDKHSSDEDEEDLDLEALYQITPEQKDYYLKQFSTVQPDIAGLLSGVVAKVFFEKSRIPVDELRRIWQLTDVTRDGALDVAEFTAAMHLVVLRRNNIPIPSSLPTCLQPSVLCKTLGLPQKEAPIEADLLQLESDNDNQEQQQPQQLNINKKDYQRMVSSTYDEYRSNVAGGKSISSNKSSTLPKNHFSSRSELHQRGEGDGSAATAATNNSSNNLNTNNSNVKQMSEFEEIVLINFNFQQFSFRFEQKCDTIRFKFPLNSTISRDDDRCRWKRFERCSEF